MEIMISENQTTQSSNQFRKMLVAINNFGDGHADFVSRLIAGYKSMPFETDIIVLSDQPKSFVTQVEVRVGLPTKNPWSLPFGHKKVFADRLHDYDLFVYTEDDILVTIKTFRPFCRRFHS